MAFEMKPYWLVHGDGPTNQRHATKQSARKEADRLARQHPGTVFAVLQAIEAVRKVDVERISVGSASDRLAFDADDQIPF